MQYKLAVDGVLSLLLLIVVKTGESGLVSTVSSSQSVKLFSCL